MILNRFDYTVGRNEKASIVLRYLRGTKCWLLEHQLNCVQTWSEVFDTESSARQAFRDQVKLEVN